MLSWREQATVFLHFLIDLSIYLIVPVLFFVLISTCRWGINDNIKESNRFISLRWILSVDDAQGREVSEAPVHPLDLAAGHKRTPLDFARGLRLSKRIEHQNQEQLVDCEGSKRLRSPTKVTFIARLSRLTRFMNRNNRTTEETNSDKNKFANNFSHF